MIKIVGRPEFFFQLTLDQIDILLKLADKHYDAICRQAAALDGFINGWRRQVLNTMDMEIETDLQATIPQLNICIRICEWYAWLNHAEKQIVQDMLTWFVGALAMAEELQRQWRAMFKPEQLLAYK